MRGSRWLQHPASPQSLRQARLVADVEGIIQVLEDILTRAVLGCALACTQRKLHWHEVPADLLFQLLPVCRAWPGGIAGPNPAECGLRRHRPLLSIAQLMPKTIPPPRCR